MPQNQDNSHDSSGAAVRRPPEPPIDAVLWDMDGTIVDSELSWMQAERELTARFGLSWTETDALQLVGQALPSSAEILRRHGVALSAREIIDTLSSRVIDLVLEDIPWRPGARELLLETRTAGIPCALVTMSEGPFAQAIVDALPEGTFDTVVTGDRVARGKPEPDAYELGFQELVALHGPESIRRERCLALEDSWPGYQAAVAAGLVTVAVPLHAALPNDPERIEWDTMEGKRLSDAVEAMARATLKTVGARGL